MPKYTAFSQKERCGFRSQGLSTFYQVIEQFNVIILINWAYSLDTFISNSGGGQESSVSDHITIFPKVLLNYS